MSSFRIDDLPEPGSPNMAMCMRSADDRPNAGSRTRGSSSPPPRFFFLLLPRPPSLDAALRAAAEAAAAAAASGLSYLKPM